MPGPRTGQSRFIRGGRWDDPAQPTAPPREEKPTEQRSVTE